jgi:hypothetical protein
MCCRVLPFGWDFWWVSWISVVSKDPVALIVRVGVLTLVCWLDSQSDQYGHLIIPSFQLAHSSPLACKYSPGCCCKWEWVLSQVTGLNKSSENWVTPEPNYIGLHRCFWKIVQFMNISSYIRVICQWRTQLEWIQIDDTNMMVCL